MLLLFFAVSFSTPACVFSHLFKCTQSIIIYSHHESSHHEYFLRLELIFLFKKKIINSTDAVQNSKQIWYGSANCSAFQSNEQFLGQTFFVGRFFSQIYMFYSRAVYTYIYW